MGTNWKISVGVSLTLVFMSCDAEMSTDAGVVDEGVMFPSDYASTFQIVRGCRANGGSHDFNQIRVLADEAAFDAYQDRVAPFPPGAMVLKEEFDANDFDCSGPIVQWTAMQRLADGENDEELNWRWQKIASDRSLLTEDEPRCYGCHAACVAPDGYDHTCTVP